VPWNGRNFQKMHTVRFEPSTLVWSRNIKHFTFWPGSRFESVKIALSGVSKLLKYCVFQTIRIVYTCAADRITKFGGPRVGYP